MLAAQKHYGPDRRAIAEVGPFALGRNLFALLPEDDWDQQPLAGGPASRYSLVADIRLDNRDELSAKLGLSLADARGFADSDYLLKALERWGDEAPHHLLGDFAFAWFDRHERRLLLARDPLGQRPLFWHRNRNFVAFASMPKGLHALKQIHRSPNTDAAARFVEHGFLLPGESFFSGIERVQPGHIVSITQEGESRRRYWKPKRRTLQLGGFEDYVDAYRSELDRAVRVRLRSREDVVATHLSGGWDSGAVTATASRLSTGRIIAFTAAPLRGEALKDPQNRFSDEWPLAQSVAALYPKIEHYRVENDLSSPLDSLEKGASCFERPLFNLCNQGWLAQIREASRARGAQVLLSGEIGNWSISAGPADVLSEYRREYGWIAWWRVARGLRARGDARWRGIVANSFRDLLPENFWRALAPLSLAESVESALRPELRSSLNLPCRAQSADRFSRTVEAYSQMDFGEYRKGILGGWGIDERDPTADVGLIEFCLSLPAKMLVNEHSRRPLARAALSDRLSPQVLSTTEKGYQSAEWYLSLERDFERVKLLVASIGGDAVAASVIDAERLAWIIRTWPSTGWDSRLTISIYRNTLLEALTAGHFLIHAQGPS